MDYSLPPPSKITLDNPLPVDPRENALQAVVHGALVASRHHITFLSVAVFVFIVVMSTTHLQLFLGDSTISLPLLGVGVSLRGFYALAPWVVVILHLNLLLQCRLLADSTEYFQRQIANLKAQEKKDWLNRLPYFPLVQMLTHPERSVFSPRGLMAGLFRLSVVGVPLVVLSWIQLRFLPYHGEWFTWNHRIALIVDAVVLLSLWFFTKKTCWSRLPLRVVSIVFVFLATVIFTIPDSWVEEKMSHLWAYPDSQYQHSFYLSGSFENLLNNLGFYRNLQITHKSNPIVGGKIDDDTRNALLGGENERIQRVLHKIPALDLGERNFQYANLRGAQLQGADVSLAQLQGANLRSIDIDWAYLLGAESGKLEDSKREKILTEMKASGINQEELDEIRERLSHPSFNGKFPQGQPPWRCLGEGNFRGLCLYQSAKEEPYNNELAEKLVSLACEERAIATGLWRSRVKEVFPTLEEIKPGSIPMVFSLNAVKKLEDPNCRSLFELSDKTKGEIRTIAKKFALNKATKS